MQQYVFGAPLDAPYDCATKTARKARRDRPAQAPIAHDELEHTLPEQRGRNAATRGFYFREFWHLPAGERACRLLDLRFFIGDVLARDRIEFTHLHLVRMQTLVLGSRVVVAGASRRDELDLVTHEIRPSRPGCAGLQPPRRRRASRWCEVRESTRAG